MIRSEKRFGLLKVSYEYILNAVKLPDEYVVADVVTDFERGCFTYKIYSDKFPCAVEGKKFPTLDAEIRADEHGKILVSAIRVKE